MRRLLLSALLLSATLAAPQAAAARPAAPAMVVLEVTDFETWTEDGIVGWQAWYTVRLALSADDPDQVTGDFTYRETARNGHYPTGDTIIASSDPDWSAVAGRPGWVLYNETTEGFHVANAVTTFNWTADDGSGLEGRSGPSCEVIVNLAAADAHGQCGPTIAAPPGVSGVVLEVINDGNPNGARDLRFLLSPDDPDADTGDFDYHVFRSYSLVADEDLGADPVGAGDGDGVRLYSDTTGHGKQFKPYHYHVEARDPLTLRRSENSCRITLNPVDHLFDQTSCGELGLPGVGVSTGVPQFPLLDVTDAAEAFNVTDATMGLVLGSVLLLGGGAAGAIFAQGVGAAVGGILAFVVATALNLWPAWIAVVVFLTCVAIVVLRMKGGGE